MTATLRSTARSGSTACAECGVRRRDAIGLARRCCEDRHKRQLLCQDAEQATRRLKKAASTTGPEILHTVRGSEGERRRVDERQAGAGIRCVLGSVQGREGSAGGETWDFRV